MSSLTTIDVVIPVYNGEKFILDAIRSIENQTSPVRCILVVDDGSTDLTQKIVTEYVSKTNIKYFKKENAGPNSARNLGIKNSQADLIAFLDADDLWHPQKLEKQLSVFNQTSFKNLGVVYCDFEVVDENKKTFIEKKSFNFDQSYRGSIYHKMFVANKIAGSASSVLIKKNVFEKVGLFDETLKYAEDWDMWIRISKEYEFDYCLEKLVSIRRHSQSAQNNPQSMFSHFLVFSKKWLKEAPQTEVWANHIAGLLLKSGFAIFANLTKLHAQLSASEKRKLFKKYYGSVALTMIMVLWSKIKNEPTH